MNPEWMWNFTYQPEWSAKSLAPGLGATIRDCARSLAQYGGQRSTLSSVSIPRLLIGNRNSRCTPMRLTLDFAIDLGSEQHNEYRKPHPGEKNQRQTQ
jgi:hypothetical protein